jgi:glycosyltransferase involved in cell wall biosynthesis
MYRGLSVVAVIPVLNEEQKIVDVVRRVPRDVVDEVVVVDDGSTDNSAAVARDNGATVISLGRIEGVGAALRTGYRYASEKDYDAVITIAGNNKDFPEETPLLLDPIVDEAADFVQGSRWLRPESLGEMPLYRKLATRVHPLLFSLVARRRVTESTNGFRAFTKRVLRDQRIDLDQAWLDKYELEPYLYIKVIRLGYVTREVPVHKVYPPKQLGQTKMAPITGWWSILRPLVLIGLGIKK